MPYCNCFLVLGICCCLGLKETKNVNFVGKIVRLTSNYRSLLFTFFTDS